MRILKELDPLCVATYHVFDCGGDLSKNGLGLVLGEGSDFGEPGKELPTRGILHDQVEITQGLGHLVEPEKVDNGMDYLI
jgi:hypothetical protein